MVQGVKVTLIYGGEDGKFNGISDTIWTSATNEFGIVTFADLQPETPEY